MCPEPDSGPVAAVLTLFAKVVTLMRESDTESQNDSEHDHPGFAWLSGGRLFVQRPAQELLEVESSFARETLERRLRSEQLNSWKDRSGVWGSMGVAPPEMAQWQAAAAAPRRVIHFRSVTRGDQPGQLFYVLDLGNVGGLFQYDLNQGYETRLMHREGFITSDLSRHPGGGEVAVAMRRSDGTTGVAIGEKDGRYLKDVTFSDGVDESPAWLDDGSRRLVYQSAAWLRDDNGFARSLSPYRVEMLDLDAERISTVYEEDNCDLLQPRYFADDTLYFIRRPYRAKQRQRPLLEDVKDILLWPFRLIRAILHFLNFFSVMFSGKPLTTAGGPDEEEARTPGHLMLWGQMVDTRHFMKRRQSGDSARLVPKDWELVRRSADGTESVLASGVLSFDVLQDGRVIYTDGSRIMTTTEDGRESVLAEDVMIERVSWLSAE